MKTSKILLVVICLTIFALFYRLYQGKLIKLNSREGFQCLPKSRVSKITDRIDQTMRLYVNENDPIVKGGSIKFTSRKHVDLMINDLRNLLSMYLKNFCNLKIVRMEDTAKITKLVNGKSNIIKIVNISITDKDSEINLNSNSSGLGNQVTGSQVIGSQSAPDITTPIKKQRVVLDHNNPKFIESDVFINLFKNPNNNIDLCSDMGKSTLVTKTIELPLTINLSTLRLNFDFMFRDQGDGNYTDLKIVMYNNGKEIKLYQGKNRIGKEKSKTLKHANMSINLSQQRYGIKPGNMISFEFKTNRCFEGHKLFILKMKKFSLEYDRGSLIEGFQSSSNNLQRQINASTSQATEPDEEAEEEIEEEAKKTELKDFFAPIDIDEKGVSCMKLLTSYKTEKKKLPEDIKSDLKINFEYKKYNDPKKNASESRIYLINETKDPEEKILIERHNKPGESEISNNYTIPKTVVSPGDTIYLEFTENKCNVDHPMVWYYIKNMHLTYYPTTEEDLVEEEFEEISLPYEDQIIKFCYDKTCPYYFIDFHIKIKDKTIDMLSYFTVDKINDDEGFLQMVELVGQGRKYNSLQRGMFRVLNLAKSFLFSRKYAEVDPKKLCVEGFTSNEEIGETLNRELISADFDISTLVEEYYSQRGQNLLFIKENIQNNLIKNCDNDKLKEFLIENKDTMDTISKLDTNVNVLKSMINMTGDFSESKDKEIDKMSGKWNEFHSMYKSQLEDLLMKKLSIADPDHRIERDTHKYRINKFKRDLEKLRVSNNPNSDSYDKFYRNQAVSLQNQFDGTVLNYSRVSEKGRYLDKYMIFANGGCLKNLGGKLVIEYDYIFQRNNSNLHFNLEIITDPKDYIAKMNTSKVDVRRNKNFQMDETPTVLISPVGMYSKVIVIENEKIFLDNCTGKLSERFRFRELIESPCDFPEKEVN